MRTAVLAITIAAVTCLPQKAAAWGAEGHRIIAAIAEGYLTPKARARVATLLAADQDTLTAPDLMSRATWADAWRGAGHRETAKWHFIDIELDRPDLVSACAGRPPALSPASAGPAEDCIVGRIEAFERELRDSATSQPERILALKYLLHLVGDLHQPLHASDNHDRGGNCLRVALGEPRTTNLHSFWDTAVVEALGRDPIRVASSLRAQIIPAEKSAWSRGDPAQWGLETYQVAKESVYWSGVPAGCDRDAPPVALPPGYAERATRTAAVQLEKAGVRLASVLNRSLG